MLYCNNVYMYICFCLNYLLIYIRLMKYPLALTLLSKTLLQQIPHSTVSSVTAFEECNFDTSKKKKTKLLRQCDTK